MLILAFISSAHADTTPPEIGITYSPSVVTTEDEVTFTAKASDPSGITKIEILVNAKLVKKCSSSPCVYEGGPYPKGDVSYVANAYDELGNRAWSGYESFVVVEVAKPESMLEIEEIYDTKVKQVKETIAEEELLKELQKVEEEKKRLIEEFAAKMEELELRRVTIIKKLKINKSDVLLDDIKIQAKPVEIDVEGKEVRIEPSPKGLALVEGGIKAEGDVELEYENRTLIALNSGKPIKFLPSQVRGKVKGELKQIEIRDEEIPKYIVKGEEEGKLLWLIPISVETTYEIDAKDGRIIKEEKPWWSFAVKIEIPPKVLIQRTVIVQNIVDLNNAPKDELVRELEISPALADIITKNRPFPGSDVFAGFGPCSRMREGVGMRGAVTLSGTFDDLGELVERTTHGQMSGGETSEDLT